MDEKIEVRPDGEDRKLSRGSWKKFKRLNSKMEYLMKTKSPVWLGSQDDWNWIVYEMIRECSSMFGDVTCTQIEDLDHPGVRLTVVETGEFCKLVLFNGTCYLIPMGVLD
jgi:hypothetical protein